MKTPDDFQFSADAGLSRRGFLKAGAALTALPVLGAMPPLFAAGSDRIKIGLVGCGNRGSFTVRNCVAADPAVQLWALGDLFPDKVDAAFRAFANGFTDSDRPGAPALPADQMAVTPEQCFSGFDAYKAVIGSGIDIVLLVTPPHFRPLHLQAAVDAGVHVFAEKPVAVDPVGARRVIEIAAQAERKKLAFVAGTQRRHARNYIETMARVRDGAIGDLVSGQCYWVDKELWHKGHPAGWTDMEYQIRNWLYFTWLSGDHIVEQHVHNLDVMNWAFGGPPVKALGMGGRQTRTDPKYGDIWDHFSVEYEYANGARVQSFCRQADGATRRISERLVGTRGVANPDGAITGQTPWSFAGETDGPKSTVQEHVDLIRGIREGRPLNHGRRIAESTLTAILGRMSAYTGRELSYSWLLNVSRLDLAPPAYEFGDAPDVTVAVPGRTPLI